MAIVNRDLAPSPNDERLDLVDALRGFALAGVLFVNVGVFTLYFYLDRAARAALPTAAFDAVMETFTRICVDRKAMTLFSMLFGYGFAIQLERAKKRGTEGLSLYVRRVWVLMLFGLLHVLLIWWGDILLMYALLALLLVPMRNLSSRALLSIGFFTALIAPALIANRMDEATASLPTFAQMQAYALAMFSSASYESVVKGNLRFGLWTYAAWWDDWLFIFGRFVLGYWAGRHLLFHNPVENQDLLKRIFVPAALLGLLATVLEIRQDDLVAALPALKEAPSSLLVDGITRLGPLGMGIAYACGFALLFRLPRWRARLSLLAPVGRMALTCYLMQSVICLAIFYGIGLGVGPGHGYASRLLAWGMLFGLQIAFCRWWLTHFRFGPAEWLWRSLTYGRPQPMRHRRVISE